MLIHIEYPSASATVYTPSVETAATVGTRNDSHKINIELRLAKPQPSIDSQRPWMGDHPLNLAGREKTPYAYTQDTFAPEKLPVRGR